MEKSVCLIFLFLLFGYFSSGQRLRPGFDKAEYLALMHVSAQFGDTGYRATLPPPQGYKQLYASPVMGLENKWELWVNDANVPIISIRGTTASEISWMANFYAAMVPAKGSLQLSESSKFTYQLATNPKAAVHVGWLISTAFLAKDILPQIDSLQKKGASEMLIIGHSQGGAIAYLLTAYLHNLQKQNLLSPALRFKTYCSAGPKPGNLYFAHEYEAATQGGWAYNVVNSADWVPETPVTVQTLGDFNTVNPFVNAKGIIKQQSFFKRLALNYAFGKLKNPNQNVADNYKKYLGSYVAKSIKKHLPGFVEPAYASSINYVRTGHVITLLADDEYYQKFPQDPDKVFINHFHQPYLFLLNKLNMDGKQQPVMAGTLSGTWELNYVSGSRIAFERLYPDKKPILAIDESAKKINGNTSCNSFTGMVTIDGNAIQFPEAMAMTKMLCPGEGEQNFLKVLRTVNRYSVADNTLTLIMGDIAVMRFRRKL